MADGLRRFALTAMMPHKHADKSIDVFKVLKMALVRDLAEVYAGDAFAYDDVGNDCKEERERAADRLFAIILKTKIWKFGGFKLSLTQWKRLRQNMPRQLTGSSPL